jgi:hypothetical protein
MGQTFFSQFCNLQYFFTLLHTILTLRLLMSLYIYMYVCIRIFGRKMSTVYMASIEIGSWGKHFFSQIIL